MLVLLICLLGFATWLLWDLRAMIGAQIKQRAAAAERPDSIEADKAAAEPVTRRAVQIWSLDNGVQFALDNEGVLWIQDFDLDPATQKVSGRFGWMRAGGVPPLPRNCAEAWDHADMKGVHERRQTRIAAYRNRNERVGSSA
jgi:hypothetical protein